MSLRVSFALASTHLAAAAKLYVTEFQAYPDYSGNLAVAGTMTIETSGTGTAAKQSLQWKLSGLDTACTANAADNVTNGCGIHVHTGTSCTSAADIGGHFYNSALSEDPWLPIVYVAEADGTSQEHTGVEVTTGKTKDDIDGKVVVVHELASGTRIACGVIGTETGDGAILNVPTLEVYPGYSGNLTVAGNMDIETTSGTETTAKQCLKWSLTGVDTACVADAGENVSNGCGIHVHTGTSCTSAADVGGHYYSSALTSDPWSPIVYEASADGTSTQEACLDVVTGLSSGDILGRVMVVHELATGTRIACGVIGVKAGQDAPSPAPSPVPSPANTGAGNTSAAGNLGATFPYMLALLVMGWWTS